MGMLNATAAIVEAPGSGFRLDTVEIDAPGPGQVRVEVHACGVCHTDMVMEEGHLPVPFPVIFGHEGAGVVEAVGPGVTEVAPGDRVLLSFHSCGHCPACDDHQPGYCREFVPRNFLGALDPGEGGVHRNGAQIGSNRSGPISSASRLSRPMPSPTPTMS
jgi:aryl-alcohol dehydrogenase